MATNVSRSRRARLGAGVVVVAAGSALIAPAAHAGGSTKWVALSSGNINSTLEAPAITKVGKGYQVIWVARPSANFAIQSRILNAAGKPQGGVITALSGWGGIQPDPTILTGGSTRVIAFGGAKSGVPADNTGAEYDLVSTNGKTWTKDTGSLSANDGADHSPGAAVVNDNGTIITGIAENEGVLYHVGRSAQNPAPGTDPETVMTGSGTEEPGLGVDAKTHDVWAVWFSDSGGSDLGIHAQVIYPTVGAASHGPDATASGSAHDPNRDMSAASRVGGGVYTAYPNPTGMKLVVWQLGKSKPVAQLNAPTGVANAIAVAGPKGRIWVAWSSDSGWSATRSNKKVTKFGPVTNLTVPKNATTNFHIAGYGANGPLELVAMYTPSSGKNGVYATQIDPKLTVKTSPGSVKPGKKFTVTVTDAGDPVKGAKVSFDGSSAKTNKKGKATVKVAKNAKTGKQTVSVKAASYAKASTTETVS